MKKFSFSLLLLSLFLLQASLLVAQTATQGQEEMTIEKAIALGLQNNFTVKIDAQAIQIAANNASWAMAGRAPTIDLRGFANNNLTKDNNVASFLQGTYYNGSFGGAVDATWVVYNGGRVRIAKEQLDLALGQERLNQESGIHDLIREIYATYYEVLLQQERLTVLRQSLDLSISRLAYEQAKREFGSSNTYNLTQFESGVITDSNNVVSQRLQLEVAKRNLYNTLDLSGEASGAADYVFYEELNTTFEEIDAAKLRNALSENNYTLKSLSMLTDLSSLNSRLEKAARLPTVSVTGTGRATRSAFKFYEDDPATGDPFDLIWSNQFGGSLNANLSWNLYNGGTQNTAIENARLQQEIAQLNSQEAKLQMDNQLDILIANYQSQRELLRLADEQLKVAERNLEMTEERFKAGTLTSLDFRNVQNQYLDAAFNKVSGIYKLILTKTEIDYLVGKFN